MNRILEVSRLTKKYHHNKVVAINNLSFDLKKGEIATVVGSSGSGKTTLLRISGLIPDEGFIKLNKKVINSDNTFIVPEKRNCSLVFKIMLYFQI